MAVVFACVSSVAVAFVAVACTGGVSSPSPLASVEASSVASVEPSPDQSSSACAAEQPIENPSSGTAFTGPENTEFRGLPVFSSHADFNVGILPGAVTVTVIGTNAEAVQTFTSEAKFEFAVEDPQPAIDEAECGDTEPRDLEPPDVLDLEDLLDDQASPNLYIEFGLSADAAGAHQPGVLSVKVDPRIDHLAIHDYYMQNNTAEGEAVSVSLSVTITKAAAYLYLNCDMYDWAKADPASRGSIKSNDLGKFDMFVFGSGDPYSSYLLRGSWAYSSYQQPTGPRVNC